MKQLSPNNRYSRIKKIRDLPVTTLLHLYHQLRTAVTVGTRRYTKTSSGDISQRESWQVYLTLRDETVIHDRAAQGWESVSRMHVKHYSRKTTDKTNGRPKKGVPLCSSIIKLITTSQYKASPNAKSVTWQVDKTKQEQKQGLRHTHGQSILSHMHCSNPFPYQSYQSYSEQLWQRAKYLINHVF